MKKVPHTVRNVSIMLVLLCLAFLISLLFQQVFDVEEHITTLFVFAVFLTSLLTEGYVYGMIAAVVSVLAVNYAFTFPYFAFNFNVPVNFVSAIIMIVIAALTSMLTTKVKQHQAIQAETERERMRANLLRAVSHDLRTPLTTIYGSAATLLEKKGSLTEQQQERMLEGIKEDSEWLVRMVENLLSITRLDSGKVKIIKTPTVLDELIDSVLLKFNKRYPRQTILLDIPDEIVIIPMDALLIEQVIINILENAVQHAVGMTSLWLRVFVIGGKAIFEIQDDGCGMDPYRLKSIFTGGYNGNEPPADGQKRNSGIGLSVCATIIKAHGGDISAANRKEGGAIFRFTLDREEAMSE